eukprot:14447328-Alexandrium_andersonii.AAC.1
MSHAAVEAIAATEPVAAQPSASGRGGWDCRGAGSAVLLRVVAVLPRVAASSETTAAASDAADE